MRITITRGDARAELVFDDELIYDSYEYRRTIADLVPSVLAALSLRAEARPAAGGFDAWGSPELRAAAPESHAEGTAPGGIVREFVNACDQLGENMERNWNNEPRKQ